MVAGQYNKNNNMQDVEKSLGNTQCIIVAKKKEVLVSVLEYHALRLKPFSL